MSKKLSPIWLKRWQALEKAMNSSEIQDTTLKSMLACLKAFGEDQIRFFYDGFNNGRLLPSMNHPAENVLSSTLAQVSYDLSAIRQAADQRRSPKLKTTLDKADQLAQSALNLAIEKGLLEPGAVVTYFDKSPYIRVIPYAPVALVGIPYTAIESQRDLLAIPHEVGHYVYRHTSGLAANLLTQIPFDPPWFYRWLEEIFSDIYGCLVAGPVIGVDFQDLLLDNAVADFTVDDGEHPVDAIRPFVYIRVLEKLGFKNAAEALDIRWAKHQVARHYPESFGPYGTEDEIDLDYAREKIEEVVGVMLDYLLKDYNLKPESYWSEDLPPSNNDTDSLYEAFETWVNQSINITVNQLQVQGKKVGVSTENGDLKNIRHIGSTKSWQDKFKKFKDNVYVLPSSAWELIFAAGSWPNKGPDGDPDVGM
ncbi:MAG: hypothetical protein DWQ04_23835 [Chloroflexi bacterium]|nr:MAG: hypothetical protein DWQ04_23835 [Chloroflexota bacterium]